MRRIINISIKGNRALEVSRQIFLIAIQHKTNGVSTFCFFNNHYSVRNHQSPLLYFNHKTT